MTEQREAGLDVERLARALEPVTRPLYAGENVDAWRRDTAKKIAAEYRRLMAAPPSKKVGGSRHGVES